MIKNNLLVLFVLLFSSPFFAQDDNFNVLLIPENLKEDANSIVRLENISIDMKSQNEMIVVTERAVTIYNKLADDIANIRLDYDKRRSIKSVTAIVYDAFGNEVKKIKKRDFKDYSAYDGISLYNDGRLLYYDHTPTSYPYTIYYKYEVKTSNTAFINRWIPVRGYYQSVEKASFSLKYPLDVIVKKSERNFTDFAITVNENPGRISYKIDKVPAIKYESYAPLFYDVFPNVKLGVNKFNLEGVDGEANNWSDFGKWYYDNLIKYNLNLKEETREKIKALTANVDDPIEKAKIVYEYVQNKVRYISVQVGIGGFKPMPATYVDDLGYGDCKALTNYTASLLKEVGIESYHTLVYANDKIDMDAKVASPEGNHMILYVPISGQDIWLECTSQKSPFAEIGDFTDDRDALVITPEGGILKHTKVYKVEENFQFTKGAYEIDGNGTIKATVLIKSSGTQYGDNLQKYDGKSQKDLDILFKNYLSNINNIKFSKIEVLNNKDKSRFEEHLEFNATDYVSFSGAQLLMPINAFNKMTSVPKRVRNRKLPFEISSGFLDIDEVEIKLPTAYHIFYIPENVEIKSKFGTYSMELIKIDEQTYNYKRKFKLEEGKFPKEEYDAYRNFIKKIRKYDNLKIVLNK